MRREIDIRLSKQAKILLDHLRKKYKFPLSDDEVLDWFCERGWTIGDQDVHISMFMEGALEELKREKENGL